MATSNFYNKNATKIFASEIEDDFDYECLVDNIITNLKEKTDKNPNISMLRHTGKFHDEAHVLGSIAISKNYNLPNYGEIEVNVNIDMLLRHGYYAGINLDWDYQFEIEGDEVSEWEDIISTLEYLCDKRLVNKTNFIDAWFSKTKDQLSTIVEDVYECYTDSYVVSARFSNGETWYEKVS